MVGRANQDWRQLLAKYGLGTVLALVLTYFLMHNVSESIAKVSDTLNQHVGDMKSQQIESRFYLRAICLNTAETEAQRAGCEVSR